MAIHTVCQQRQNGNMPRELVRKEVALLVKIQGCFHCMHGLAKILPSKHILLARKKAIRGDCTICMVMCGNLCRIGTGTIRQNILLTLKVRVRARTACCAVVVGTTMCSTCVLPIAATT